VGTVRQPMTVLSFRLHHLLELLLVRRRTVGLRGMR